LACIQSIDI